MCHVLFLFIYIFFEIMIYWIRLNNFLYFIFCIGNSCLLISIFPFVLLLIFQAILSGWVDESVCSRRHEDFWGEGYGPQSFTTGRRGKLPPPPTKPRPKASQTLKVSVRDANLWGISFYYYYYIFNQFLIFKTFDFILLYFFMCESCWI